MSSMPVSIPGGTETPTAATHHRKVGGKYSAISSS
jgi:hypothetical protein